LHRGVESFPQETAFEEEHLHLSEKEAPLQIRHGKIRSFFLEPMPMGHLLAAGVLR
jgi:hypothetical protein